MTTEYEDRRTARIARDWRYEEGLERQAQLLRDNPAEHDRVFGPSGRIAVGLYESGKAAADALAAEPEKKQPAFKFGELL